MYSPDRRSLRPFISDQRGNLDTVCGTPYTRVSFPRVSLVISGILRVLSKWVWDLSLFYPDLSRVGLPEPDLIRGGCRDTSGIGFIVEESLERTGKVSKVLYYGFRFRRRDSFDGSSKGLRGGGKLCFDFTERTRSGRSVPLWSPRPGTCEGP